jgi:biopolymer transport protein ExbB
VLWFALLAWCTTLPGRDSLVVMLSQARAQQVAPDGSGRIGRTGAAAGEGGAQETGAAESKSSFSQADSSESILVWMARAAGPVFWVIALMSFYLFALIVWMALRYRGAVALPQSLVREIEHLLEHKRFSEAYHRLAADESLLARVLAAGVRKLPSGLPAAQRAIELSNEEATMQMEHRTTYLATVGTLGPMIGLVGTVYGMIIAFRVIATEGATPQASQLAAGISTALFSTLLGIGVSIPAIFFYSMFRNRIARLSLEVAMRVEPLLEQFAPGVRKEEPASAPAHAPASSPSPMPLPIGGPVTHPHPYATSAALAVALGASRSALPPAEPQ